MNDGAIIAEIYKYSSSKTLNQVEQNNLQQLIETADQKKILDIESLTRIRRIASGGFWPNDGEKVHDTELVHGPPMFTRQVKQKIGQTTFDFTVMEYYFATSFQGGSIVDNRVLCTIQGVVYSNAVFIEIRHNGGRNLLRTSSDPMLGCGRGRAAYFADDIEYKGIFGNIRIGKTGNFRPPPGAKVRQYRW